MKNEIRCAVLTDVGGRDHNEDCADALQDDHSALLVLADGLGGHGKGEVASALAVETVKECWKKDPDSDIRTWFERSQEKVLQEQKAQNAESQMKTTLTCALIRDGEIVRGHIGDSRAYIFRNCRYESRTLDHSVPQSLVNAGMIRESEIRHHEDRNRVLRVVGSPWKEGTRYCDVETRQTDGAFYAVLLCSDGWWELIDEKEMSSCLKKADSPEQWLALMREIIRRNGSEGMDNYTAAAAWIGKKKKSFLF
ncbi:Serine/threonine protein phosphatase PrpC [[Clostridium] aminophilum]|uniref:Serine/threonine protein phosphatase PrpC n=1 Tax=[Clostridium] aminophilum TaxID=1526 RepID=A0A1I0EIZ1_9FIRM|nr:protein phosphatase 2C domain-containing protein [[Clostridium] aminophilum]SET45384.1 Serine/threonine protein phosphatase PrpC [[Clostridium] aminophilum]